MIIKEIKEFRLTEEEKSAIIAIAKARDDVICQHVDCTRCPLRVFNDENTTVLCFSRLAKEIIARGDLRDN